MNAVFRIIELLLAFKFGQSGGLAEKSQALTASVLNHIRQMVVLVVIAIAALALFCVGVSMLLEDVLRNIDLHGVFTVTATFYGSLALTLVTLGTIGYCLRERTWLQVTGVEKEEEKRSSSTAQTSPIENALALVITDFVQERQHHRASEKSEP